MKSKIVPILKREYLARVLTKGFWLSTALFPMLIGASLILPAVMASKSGHGKGAYKVIDTVGDFFPIMEDAANAPADREVVRPPLLNEKLSGRTVDAVRRELNDQSESGKIRGYLVITSAAIRDGKMTLFARNPSSAISDPGIQGLIRESTMKYRLLHSGVSRPQVDAAIGRVSLEVEKATNDPKKKQNGISALLMSFSLVFLIYMSLIFYGIYVLRGVLEEKSNRIVEIVVSSVKPFELMMGKILGIGAVGLTQMSIWLVCAVVLTSPQILAAMSVSRDLIPPISGLSLTFMPIFFVLGFFLFATIYAAIGSMFNSEEDAQQMVQVAQLFVAMPMFVLIPVMQDPSGRLATTLSMIPFFSPTIMYLRIAVQTPPAWQIATSIAIMIVTILFMTWLSAKIYRVGILMYGKKPTIPEVVRWLRYT